MRRFQSLSDHSRPPTHFAFGRKICPSQRYSHSREGRGVTLRTGQISVTREGTRGVLTVRSYLSLPLGRHAKRCPNFHTLSPALRAQACQGNNALTYVPCFELKAPNPLPLPAIPPSQLITVHNNILSPHGAKDAGLADILGRHLPGPILALSTSPLPPDLVLK